MNDKAVSIKQKPIFFDHDGAADDFIALITLLTFERFKLNGVSISEGNCFLAPSVIANLKILELFGLHNTLIAKGNSLSENPYPQKWREKCNQLNEVNFLSKTLANEDKISGEDTAEYIAHRLLEEPEPTTVILTGPATNLALALEKYPLISEKIEKVLWQAGAFLSDGDVVAPDVDGSAEWNIFCDTKAAQSLLNSGLTIVLFPLDLCYSLPIDNYLLFNLTSNENSKLSQLTYQFIELLEVKNKKKYLKALMPVMYLNFPEIFTLESISIGIEQRGTSLGNVFRSKTGSRVKYAKKVDDDSFFELFTDLIGTI